MNYLRLVLYCLYLDQKQDNVSNERLISLLFLTSKDEPFVDRLSKVEFHRRLALPRPRDIRIRVNTKCVSGPRSINRSDQLAGTGNVCHRSPCVIGQFITQRVHETHVAGPVRSRQIRKLWNE